MPLAYRQADGRLVLEVLVSVCIAFVSIVMWLIIKEAFNQWTYQKTKK